MPAGRSEANAKAEASAAASQESASGRAAGDQIADESVRVAADQNPEQQQQAPATQAPSVRRLTCRTLGVVCPLHSGEGCWGCPLAKGSQGCRAGMDPDNDGVSCDT